MLHPLLQFSPLAKVKLPWTITPKIALLEPRHCSEPKWSAFPDALQFQCFTVSSLYFAIDQLGTVFSKQDHAMCPIKVVTSCLALWPPSISLLMKSHFFCLKSCFGVKVNLATLDLYSGLLRQEMLAVCAARNTKLRNTSEYFDVLALLLDPTVQGSWPATRPKHRRTWNTEKRCILQLLREAGPSTNLRRLSTLNFNPSFWTFDQAQSSLLLRRDVYVAHFLHWKPS